MNRIALCVVGLASQLAIAQPKAPAPIKLPVVGDILTINGGVDWPGLTWLYDTPNSKDAAGKIVVHWFCAPKLVGCTEDLARLVTLKESSTAVYIIAYLDGPKPQAQKLDPIRGSEGVGRGTVAFGPAVTKLFKGMKVSGPLSFVVDTENKVQLITVGSGTNDLDKRDVTIKAFASAIRLHSMTMVGPSKVRPDEKFELTLTIKLANWLSFSSKPGTNYEWKANVPKELKCTNTALKGDQLKASGQSLVVKMSCSGPRGSYEAAAQIQFGYDTQSGATGLGADGGKWKFDILP